LSKNRLKPSFPSSFVKCLGYNKSIVVNCWRYIIQITGPFPS
jgi:hypothetical protein